jgi:hypothetical protein
MISRLTSPGPIPRCAPAKRPQEQATVNCTAYICLERAHYPRLQKLSKIGINREERSITISRPLLVLRV